MTMEWQQIVAYVIVALTAALMARSQFRRLGRRRKRGCGGDCCGTDVDKVVAEMQRRRPGG